MTRDSQGVAIFPGQRVAYSYSGYVHPGEVIEVRPQVRVNQWHTKDDIRIKNLSNGKISRVRNGKAVLVFG